MADKAKIRETVSEILDGADLHTVTAKKVRQELEERLKVDLSDRRKEVDGIIMDVLNEKRPASDQSEEESEEEKPVKKASNKRRSKRESDSDDDGDDYKPEAKKTKGKKGSDSDDDWKKSGKRGGGAAAAKGAKKGGGGGYTKVCKLSPELAKVMGEDSMARHEVVKRMWKLIKEKNLYDPKNKQFAICNDELLAVFGVKRFRTFGMMKYLKNHFTD